MRRDGCKIVSLGQCAPLPSLADAPAPLRSYTVRSGHDAVSASNLEVSEMAGVHSAGFRKALRQVLENTMNTNVKVQVNQAIQAMSA